MGLCLHRKFSITPVNGGWKFEGYFPIGKVTFQGLSLLRNPRIFIWASWNKGPWLVFRFFAGDEMSYPTDFSGMIS